MLVDHWFVVAVVFAQPLSWMNTSPCAMAWVQWLARREPVPPEQRGDEKKHRWETGLALALDGTGAV